MNENSTLLPSWLTFENDYVKSGVPNKFVVCNTPSVSLFVDNLNTRIGARFEITNSRSKNQIFALTEIYVSDVMIEGRRHLEVWTMARHLFANFYRLIVEVVISVVEDNADPDTALSTAVARWKALLSRPSLMSDEAQTGLFGELWLLERLIATKGIDILDAWVGPFRYPHDFRFGNIEIEVKTTSGSRRNHHINGLNQLQPSVDCTLYLLSLKVTDAGAGGRSLPNLITDIEDSLRSSHAALQRFRTALIEVGYTEANADLYPRRRRLRDLAALIPVIDGVPRLTLEAVTDLDPRFAADRILSVNYMIDVDGFGFLDGTDQFTSIVPAVSFSGAHNV